uniref:Uncharacterized protein n=1 Tax=Alexandrium monilatum TaxID=311494 RepID=A0A7S4VP53_9DINO
MESSTVWFGVALAALTLLLALACVVGAAGLLHVRSRRADKPTKVWPDLEDGGADPPSPGRSTGKKAASGSSRPDLQKAPPMDLVETLRGLLKEEISKALQHEGISERLQRLEQKDEAAQGSVNERLDRLEEATSQPQSPAYPPPPAMPLQAPPPPSATDDLQAATLRAAATAVDEVPRQGGEDRAGRGSGGSSGSKLGFGPTSRQLRLPDPPETGFDINEDVAMRTSLKTIQRQLHKRDMQTTELHRQLRQCQEALWEQTLEARSASKRLRDLLADPSQVKAEHARELERLEVELRVVSSKLADTKAAEMRWAWIAKRQRAFFLQSEKMGQEGMDLVRRHPAGEVFVAPPPVCLEGDDENCRSPPWDVGTSHINPYVIDSWPFEPNVLAQKASAEPGLNRLDEEGSGSGSLSPSEEGSLREDEDADGGGEEEGDEDLLQPPRPPGEHGPPGTYDVEPPDVPVPEAGAPALSARSC